MTIYGVIFDRGHYFVCLFYMQPLIASGYLIGAHGTDVSVGIRLLSGETLLQAKTPLVVGGTRTQVFANSIAIAASTLNHCTS